MRKFRQRETVERDFLLKKIFAEQEEKILKGMVSEDAFDLREDAIIEVLRRIPHDYYCKLKAIAPAIIWVFEESDPLRIACVYRIPTRDLAVKPVQKGIMRYALIVLLSDVLERDRNLAIYAVAHELAHCWFRAFNPFAFSDEKEEERANNMILEWGFEREIEGKKEYIKGLEKKTKQ